MTSNGLLYMQDCTLHSECNKIYKTLIANVSHGNLGTKCNEKVSSFSLNVYTSLSIDISYFSQIIQVMLVVTLICMKNQACTYIYSSWFAKFKTKCNQKPSNYFFKFLNLYNCHWNIEIFPFIFSIIFINFVYTFLSKYGRCCISIVKGKKLGDLLDSFDVSVRYDKHWAVSQFFVPPSHLSLLLTP